MKSAVKQRLFLAAVLFFMLLSFAGLEAQARTLKLGYLDPLSGPAAGYGIPCKEGVMMAMEEINETGGLNIGGEKIKIELEIGDTGGKGTEAVNIIEKFINRDGIKIILGDLLSSSSLAWAPVIERYQGKVMALNYASAPAIAKNHPHIFNTKAPNSQYNENGRYVAKKLGLKRMVMLVQSDDFGETIRRGVGENYEKNGGKIIATKYFNVQDTDFYTQLTAIKSLDFDVLYVAGIAPAALFIFKQAKELGIKQNLVGGQATGEKDVLKKFKCADVEGVYDLATPAEALMQTGRKQAVLIADKYLKKYGKDISALAIYGYESMKILAAGLEKGGSIDDIPKIMNGLHQLKVKDIDHMTLYARKVAPGTKDLVFDQHRQSYLRIVAAQWKDCRVKFAGFIED